LENLFTKNGILGEDTIRTKSSIVVAKPQITQINKNAQHSKL